MIEKMYKSLYCLPHHECLHLSSTGVRNTAPINIMHLLEWFTSLLAFFNYFFFSSVDKKRNYPTLVSDKTLIARNVF